VYTLTVHRHAEEDLTALRLGEPAVAATIIAVLQEIQHDQSLLDSLLDHDFGADGTETFHVNKWLEFWRKNFDIWRLKIWELERLRKRYRIIYAYEIPTRSFHVLGIVSRDFDYDPTDPRSQRILRAYKDLF
jgi:hypothetical protein